MPRQRIFDGDTYIQVRTDPVFKQQIMAYAKRHRTEVSTLVRDYLQDLLAEERQTQRRLARQKGTTVKPAELIEQELGPYLVRGKTYPTSLPEPLAPWYCYTGDGGHSILAAVSQFYAIGADPEGFLVPVPVKTVLAHEWHEQEGYIVVCGLHYDDDLGLVTPPEDDEF